MDRMNILFLTVANIMDINERGIYTDLMRKFQRERHFVYIVTPRERRYKTNTVLENQSGINVLGVQTLNVQKTNFIEKGIATMLIEYQYKKAVIKYLDNIHFDLIIYSTPPITFTSIVKYLKEKYSAKTYLLLKDIFPQNAVDLGFFSKNSLIYKFFRNKEKKMYAVSDIIGCMSPANIKFIKKHNPQIIDKVIEVNPNSIDLISNKLKIDREVVRKKYNLPLDLPILIYGGNLGKPQGVDFLIKCLENNKRTDCFILIVGSGTEYKKLSIWFDNNKPDNAMLISGLLKDEYDKVIKVCDVGLIFLDNRFTIPNYPSRLLSYLENKMPIIAATDTNTDIGSIAEANGYGVWCESTNVEAFNNCIDKIITDKNGMVEMGENGYQFLINNYLVDNSYYTIMKHI